MELKSRILWGVGPIVLLGISYILCRFCFFDMHGMKQWPDFLATLSIVIVMLAIVSGNIIVPAATVIGYMGGFVLAMIFNTDGVDPGGGGTNNAWIIWGAVYISSLLIGIMLGYISKQRLGVFS